MIGLFDRVQIPDFGRRLQTSSSMKRLILAITTYDLKSSCRTELTAFAAFSPWRGTSALAIV